MRITTKRADSFAFRLAVVLLIATVCSEAQDGFDASRALIQDQVINHGVPGIAVAVARHGKVIWEQGFGWADKARQIKATQDTVFSLASLSKPLTATGIMTLVQAGKVGLDVPANTYLGRAGIEGLAGTASEATVRRLANHTSGLPLYYEFFYSDELSEPPPYDDTILSYAHLVGVPGEHFQYSNLGYGILGYIEERVSGESYAGFMQQSVFIPLGMTHTSVDPTAELMAFKAERYDNAGSLIPSYQTGHPGASAIYGSAHDLVRFGMFQLKDHLKDQSPIISDALIDEMHQPPIIDGHPGVYGLGLGVDKGTDGRLIFTHGGSMPGVSAFIQLIPSEDLVVVVLSNRTAVDVHALVNQITSSLVPSWGNAATETPGASQSLSSLAGKWIGTLRTSVNDVPIIFTIAASGEAHIKIGDQLTSLINEAEYRNGRLTGRAFGSPLTESAKRLHTSIYAIDVKCVGNSLEGAAIAESEGSRPDALPYLITLQKQPDRP